MGLLIEFVGRFTINLMTVNGGQRRKLYDLGLKVYDHDFYDYEGYLQIKVGKTSNKS